MNATGEYTIDGVTEDGTKVQAFIKVANINYVKNPSFEDADDSMRVPTYISGGNCTDIQNKAADASSGENVLHFYSTSDMEFSVEQKIEGLKADTYTLTGKMQGGDVGDDADIYLYIKVGDEIVQSDKVTLDGWGTIDDIEYFGQH